MTESALEQLAATVEELYAQVAELKAKIARMEGESAPAHAPHLEGAQEPPHPLHLEETIPEDILLAISAAVAAYLGERAHVRAVRLISTSRWSQEGRVSIQASHRLERGL